MLKLNAKDLVKRAQQLADLEHSDFISWNENVQLLNEAFQKVYQKVINHDDKTYLKKAHLIAVANNDREIIYDLPEDFYQLYSLNDYSTNRCIARNTLNDPVNTSGYSIENNQLIVRGVQRDLMMKYYPVCPTITLKADNVKSVLPNEYIPSTGIADVYDTKIAVYNASSESVIVFDILTGETIKEVTDISECIKIIAGKNGFVVKGTSAITFYPWESQDAVTVLNYITDDNKNLWFNVSLTKLSFIDEYGLESEIIDLSEKENYPSFEVGTLSEDKKIYYLEDGTVNLLDVYDIESDITEGVSMLPTTSLNTVTYFFKDLVMTANGTLYTFYNDKVETSVIGINKIDMNTGYGYTMKNGIIRGIFNDTNIDYPNNMFVQFLSYQLAIQYKAKQNQEAPGLNALYAEAESQFYDTIGRDDYSYTRINNVY